MRDQVVADDRLDVAALRVGEALRGSGLRCAAERESEAPLGYTQLAIAYGRKGDYAQADLASAQAAYLRGDNKTARDLASRAKTRFAIGTPGWVKADDIVSAKPLPGQKSN